MASEFVIILSFLSHIKSDFALQKTHEIVSSQEVLRICDFVLTFFSHNQSNLSIRKSHNLKNIEEDVS
jgi:hypothetical protein